MKLNKLVSIIIPVYNTEKYLDDCLSSAVEQSYSNLDIIIVNDGSTDNSMGICKKYAKNDDRISLFTKKNGGLSDARNFGIKHARGDLIFFLDSDDFIQANTIEVLVNILKNDNKSIAICDFEKFHENSHYSNISSIDNYNKHDFFISMLEFKNSSYSCGVMIPKAFLDEKFFIKNRYYEDLSSMYRIYSKCKKIYKVNSKLYKYRMNPNSIIHTYNQQKIKDYITSSEAMTNFLIEEYDINIKKINAYKCYVLRECYIMTSDIQYLKKAKKIINNVSYTGLSFRNKVFFLRKSSLKRKI